MPSALLLLQQFCRDFSLPDLSPLQQKDLPTSERCAVVWRVMQAVLPLEKRLGFLQGFCAQGPAPALQMLAALITGRDIDDQRCDIAFNLIQTMGGVDADALGTGMRAFCVENELPGLVAMLDKHGLESVAYNLERVFFSLPDDEGTWVALDRLKFEANPERFARELDRRIEDEVIIMTSTIKLADQCIKRLTEEKLELERELILADGDNSSAVPAIDSPKTPGRWSRSPSPIPKMVAAAGGAAAKKRTIASISTGATTTTAASFSSSIKRTIPAPNGFYVARKKGYKASDGPTDK